MEYASNLMTLGLKDCFNDVIGSSLFAYASSFTVKYEPKASDSNFT